MKTCPTCQASHPSSYSVCPQDGTALVETGEWSEGAVVRGKYRILCKVGQGGMGAVYKATHLAFDELRALKVMTPQLADDQLLMKRFKHEAVITRKLQHPNAVRVDDIDETEDGRPFIVMEYIEGRSLKKLIEEEGPLAWPRVCSIIKQVAAALDAAHRLGMVHRDIKPENIVMVETAEGEQAKVLDFGIAKIRESRMGGGGGMTLTGTGVVVGTPAYMSPEQALGKRGSELDGRSDLYSLGIVMYQMLTAGLPFKAETTVEMLMAHVQQPPADIGVTHPELQIPPMLADLTMKLLAKDRDQRPATGQALIDELVRIEQTIAESPGVVSPTVVISPAQIEARTPKPGAPSPSSASAGTSVARPAVTPPTPPPREAPAAAIPTPSLPAPEERAAPPPKQANWGLAVAAVLAVAVLGGGGWYFLSHRARSSAGSVAQPPVSNSPAPAAGTNTPAVAPAVPPPATPATGAAGGAESSQPSPVSQGSESAQKPETGNPPAAQPRSSARPKPAPDLQKQVNAAINLGDIYFKSGNYDDAIRAYQEGLKVDPNNKELSARIERAKEAKATEERLGVIKP